ncbi:hypothetical protein A1O3_00961 [Capronia epimyces CBS 606.96]|uniref:Copper acquisition factor BIM1-like domain-containing protein n=1 Tax=Capronia epimyces CBS 606.96 TaxID=1182542 RepID=W9YRZ3_9EURO|nr:uncharacterized protein A1O3_00961 [Capronia epimyces CBS 606.96]EXJ92410.1 hypothetical protein A1O3_00961 [Capronia epimyces CBS 606.96]
MIPQSVLSVLLALPLLSSAHFALDFPPPRSSDDENQASFPCGGYGQTQNRTLVSPTSIPVAMNLGHTENLVQILLAIGNDVGSSFNYEILPTIHEFGPGDFCLAAVPVPADLNITDGTNATLQVITNAHSGGGLYNCADIQFSSTAAESPSSCKNGTGISATPLSGSAYTFANQSTGHHDDSGSGSGSSSATATATASESANSASSSSSASASATSASDNSNGAAMLSLGWGLLGAVVLGAVAVL